MWIAIGDVCRCRKDLGWEVCYRFSALDVLLVCQKFCHSYLLYVYDSLILMATVEGGSASSKQNIRI